MVVHTGWLVMLRFCSAVLHPCTGWFIYLVLRLQPAESMVYGQVTAWIHTWPCQKSCYSRGYVLSYETFSGFSVTYRYCIKTVFKNKCLFIHTFAHTLGKQPKSGSKWKNTALSYILFCVAKINNHILTTLKAIPILHVANRENIFEFKIGSEQ